MVWMERALRRVGAAAAASVDIGQVAIWAMRRVLALVGLVIFVAGVIVFPLPIPFGIPLMIAGAVILLNTSDTAKRLFLRWGRRYPETMRKVRGLMRRGWRWRSRNRSPAADRNHPAS